MGKVYDFLSKTTGCVAVSLIITAWISAFSQIAWAIDPLGDGTDIAACSTPNQIVCQNNDPNNPTDCNEDTKGVPCDQQDAICHCRFSMVQLDCTCGY